MTTFASPAPSSLDKNGLPEHTLQSSNPYTVINEGLAILSAGRTDADLVLHIARAYMFLGLHGPARELLQSHASAFQNGNLNEPVKPTSALRSGRVAWGAVRTQFEQNISRLITRYPAFRSLTDTFHEMQSTCELYRSTDGEWHLAELRPGDHLRWMGSFVSSTMLATSVKFAHSEQDQFCPNYILCGDSFGAVLRRTYDATSQMFMTFSPRLFVIEPELRNLVATLCTNTNVDAYLHARTHLFAGPKVLEELANYLRTNSEIAIPTCLLCLPPFHEEYRQQIGTALESLLQERMRSTASLIESNFETYSDNSSVKWAARYRERNERPLSVLGITSRFTTVLQYATRDLKSAFERLGHRFHTLIEPNDHDMLTPLSFARVIHKHKPDLVFVIDHLRAEYGETIPADVPYVCWAQDMLPNLTTREAGRSMGPLDFYIAPTLNQFVNSYDYPASQGMVWTLATDPHLYDVEPLPENEIGPHRCDFSFVSNQSSTPEEFHKQFCDSLQSDESGRTLCSHLFEILRAELMDTTNPGYPRNAADILAEARISTGFAPSSPEMADAVARRYLHPLAELMFRHKSLEWVAKYCETTGRSLHLYGRGWERHPSLARFARGVAANGRTLRAIYQATAINLQINGYGAMHQRLLDGLASGGFFLIRSCGLDQLANPLRAFAPTARVTDQLPGGFFRRCERPDLSAAFEAERILAGGRQCLETIKLDATRVDLFRELATSGGRRVAGLVFPQYNEVAFGTYEEFAEKADLFIFDMTARGKAVNEMREIVVQRFTYDSLIRDLLVFLTRSLNQAARYGAGSVAEFRESSRGIEVHPNVAK